MNALTKSDALDEFADRPMPDRKIGEYRDRITFILAQPTVNAFWANEVRAMTEYILNAKREG
jgi:hypothetical protein